MEGGVEGVHEESRGTPCPVTLTFRTHITKTVCSVGAGQPVCSPFTPPRLQSSRFQGAVYKDTAGHSAEKMAEELECPVCLTISDGNSSFVHV